MLTQKSKAIPIYVGNRQVSLVDVLKVASSASSSVVVSLDETMLSELEKAVSDLPEFTGTTALKVSDEAWTFKTTEGEGDARLLTQEHARAAVFGALVYSMLGRAGVRAESAIRMANILNRYEEVCEHT